MLFIASLILAAQADASAVLSSAREAFASSAGLRYEATLARTVVLTWRSHTAQGTVQLGTDGAFRVDARVTEHIGEDPHRVTLSHSGERYLFLDHDERVFVESDRPTAAGLHARLAYDLAQLFPAPPGELQSVASRGSVQLGAERCDMITAGGPDGTAHTWYLSTKDHFPRLWETKRSLGEGDSLAKRLTVLALERVEEPLAALEVPEGYARREPVAWDDPESAAKRPDQGQYTKLEGSIEPFREHFNAEKAHVRAVALFAPT